MAEVCRRFEISRKTGYKWLDRYESGGVEALKDGSHAPLSNTRPAGKLARSARADRSAGIKHTYSSAVPSVENRSASSWSPTENGGSGSASTNWESSMRTSCSFAPNHPSLKLPNPNRSWLLQTEPTPWKTALKWGLRPQTLGIYRFRAKYGLPLRKRGRLAPPQAPTQPPSRRSGRIPALPYPPPGSHSISDETHDI